MKPAPGTDIGLTRGAGRFAVLLLAELAGCVPTYLMLQPETVVTVRTQDGRPLEGAQVVMWTTINPHLRAGPTSRQQTGPDGIARLDAIREWKGQTPLVMHGTDQPSWDLCVAKDGYETAYSRPAPRDHKIEAVITLVAGVSAPCTDGMEWRNSPPRP